MDSASMETVHKHIYHEVKHTIMTGVWLPGQPLSIRYLCSKFGVSATPVREALKRLESEYALVRGPNRTMVVPRLTMVQLKDLRDIRICLEGLITAKAAVRASDADLVRIVELCHQMDDEVARGDAEAFLGLNLAFHRTIYAASGIEVAVGFIESLWLRAGPYLRLPIQTASLADFKAGRKISMGFHWTCVDALQRRDEQAARDAIEQDIRNAADKLINYVTAQNQAKLDQTIPDIRF